MTDVPQKEQTGKNGNNIRNLIRVYKLLLGFGSENSVIN